MTEASGNGREPLWVREERTPGPDLGAPPGREWNDKFQGGSFWVLRAAELKRAGWVLLTVGERDERNAFDRNIQLAHVGRVAATLLSMSLENVFKAAAMARDWSLWLSELPLYLEPWRSTSQAANIPRKGIQKGELAREITIHDLGRLSMMAGVEARTPDEAEVLEAGTHLIEHWGRYPHAKKGTARSTQLSVGPRFFDAYDRMFWAACDSYLVGLNETAPGGRPTDEAAAAGRVKFISRVYEETMGEKAPPGWEPCR